MKSLITTLIFLVGLISISYSQNQLHCGTDEMHQKLFLDYPEYNPGIIHANDRLQQFTQEFSLNPPMKTGPYIIPVVFHVIHNYGPENIDNTQILDAVKQLNIQFRKLNPDTTDIVQLFKSRAADCGIEFRLAQLDPDGNCTSGITRTVSDLTSIGDHQVKSLIHWPPDKYLNVYICAEAAGLAGHAMMPPAADTIPEWDGIVMQHTYVGTIGTSDYFRRTVLSHEVGHFLNLQHIWGGNNVPNYYYLPCAAAGNCAFDDDVIDTPNTKGWQTCNLSGQSCGELDNVQNYMDYAYCALMFTEGQKTRMHAALNSPVANRNNLWQPANLLATGTDESTNYLCGAKFQADKRIVCTGDTVQFTDVSFHGITDRMWTFENGISNTTSDSLVQTVYNQQGKYDVALKVSNGTDTLSIVLTDYITVLPAEGSIAGIDQAFENEQHYYDNWITIENGIPYQWDFTNTGFQSSTSFKLSNFENPINTNFDFQSYPMDASTLSSIAIAFDWAYGRIEGSAVDILEVAVSNNCGDSWFTVKSYVGGSSLKTVTDFVTGPFSPIGEEQWKSALITTVPQAYLTSNLIVRFRFKNKGNNNLYIDNIQIGHPNELSTNNLSVSNIEVFPNPANDYITFNLGENHKVENIKVYDLTGKLVHTYLNIAQTSSFNIDVQSLQEGLYFFKISGEKGRFIVRQAIEKF